MARSTDFPPTAGDSFYKLWVLISQAAHTIQRVRQRELAPIEISPIESAVLFLLANVNGHMTPAQMARCILREGHSTSMLLQRMSEKGLITKSNDLEHKHLKRLALTDKGRIAYNQLEKCTSCERIMSCLSKDEQQQLDTSLRKLREAALAELGIKHRVPYP